MAFNMLFNAVLLDNTLTGFNVLLNAVLHDTMTASKLLLNKLNWLDSFLSSISCSSKVYFTIFLSTVETSSAVQYYKAYKAARPLSPLFPP